MPTVAAQADRTTARPREGRRLAMGLCLALVAHAAQAADPQRFVSPELEVRLSPRTPQQIAAFYEGRGFGEAMIDVLRAQCFITVSVHNRSGDILWLDLAQWRFSDADGPIERPHRDRWQERWQAMGVPLAHQSTFRWTLLPERLDFQPDERESGNLVLPRRGKPLRIEARFETRADRAGPPIVASFEDVQCALDP